MGEGLGVLILILCLSPFAVAFIAAIIVLVGGPIYAFIMNALNQDK